jgi:hypothetical protein
MTQKNLSFAVVPVFERQQQVNRRKGIFQTDRTIYHFPPDPPVKKDPAEN